ncbi:MAG: pilus assembly protein [Planctomycetaceae bacterium]|nr:pilus assembly protein [Planctomycetaceae bacterium]
MFHRSNTHDSRRSRSGATVVEMAVVLPVFGIFLAGLMETGHAYMVMDVLNSAAKQAARLGALEGKTSAQVLALAQAKIGGAVNPSDATVYIKDGSDFDTPGFDPTGISYSGLPDIEVQDAEARQLFIVRIEVPYNDVAILPPFWIKDITLSGQAVMRHE